MHKLPLKLRSRRKQMHPLEQLPLIFILRATSNLNKLVGHKLQMFRRLLFDNIRDL